MKKLAALAVALLLVAGVAYARDYEVNKKAGEYNVLVRIDKNPPVAAQNRVEITITDASGKAVTDAKVVLTYSMPAMAGMPAMNYKAEAKPQGSIYRATITYSMSGSWNNELKITHKGQTQSVRFTVDAK